MIVNHDKIATANGKVLKNTSSGLSFISVKRFFPFAKNTGGSGQRVSAFIKLHFLEETNVTVDWGNGLIEVFTTENRDGIHVFDIRRDRTNGSNESNSYDPDVHAVSVGMDFGTVGTRLIRIFYNSDLATYLELFWNVFTPQDFTLNVSTHPNLKTIYLDQNLKDKDEDLTTGGAFRNFNFRNLLQSNIEHLTLLSSTNSDYIYNSEIPEPFLNAPLKTLQISGTHNTKTFDASKINQIGEKLADTLETLGLRILFSDNQGTAETPIDPAFPNTGGLPGNLLKCTSLKVLNFTQMQPITWTKIPPIIQQMSWLEEISFDDSNKAGGGGLFTISPTYFATMTGLKKLNLRRMYTNINDFSFILSLPVGFQEFSAMSPAPSGNSGSTRQQRINDIVTYFFQWVRNNSLSEKILNIGFGGTTAPATPSGTYQEPIDHANPASPMEAIWVLRNDYDCTVIYYEP